MRKKRKIAPRTDAGEAPRAKDPRAGCAEAKEVKSMLTVPAKPERLDEVTAFVDEFLEEKGCPLKVQMQIDLALEEIFINIASYAYGGGEGDAGIAASEEDGEVTLVFSDTGAPYDPLAKPDPDVTLSADERPIGGLGIFLVKKTMDCVSYARKDGKNILTVKKRIR